MLKENSKEYKHFSQNDIDKIINTLYSGYRPSMQLIFVKANMFNTIYDTANEFLVDKYNSAEDYCDKWEDAFKNDEITSVTDLYDDAFNSAEGYSIAKGIIDNRVFIDGVWRSIVREYTTVLKKTMILAIEQFEKLLRDLVYKYEYLISLN